MGWVKAGKSMIGSVAQSEDMLVGIWRILDLASSIMPCIVGRQRACDTGSKSSGNVKPVELKGGLSLACDATCHRQCVG